MNRVRLHAERSGDHTLIFSFLMRKNRITNPCELRATSPGSHTGHKKVKINDGKQDLKSPGYELIQATAKQDTTLESGVKGEIH